MEKELLEKLVNEGLSTRKIGEYVGKSQCSVKHWLKKYELKTNHLAFKDQINEEYGEFRYCPRCKENCLTSNFYQRRGKANSSSYCKECTTEQTIERMVSFKKKCLEYKGNKCIECYYDNYYGALEFHHVNPKEKEFEISKLRSYSFNKIVTDELDKCVLLCNRCHREVEGGILILTEAQKGM